MKQSEKAILVAAIRNAVPGLRATRNLLVAVPRGSILRGLCMERSSDPRGVYLWAFVQPLFVPATSTVLSLGIRLGGGSRTWTSAEAVAAASAVRDEGESFYGPIGSVEQLARWPFLALRKDAYGREARAYALIAAGRTAEGVRAARELAGSLGDAPPWVIEVKSRAERLASLAVRDPREAMGLLAVWESETVANLMLQDVP